jgi:hypothetical protein
MISHHDNFDAIKAFLVKDPVFEINRRLQIVMIARVIVTGMILRLRGRTMDGLDLVPRTLCKNKV